MKKLLTLIFFLSFSYSQVIDLFISDWYIGWRGDGIYNNLVELYNPKDVSIDLSNYALRRAVNGGGWAASDGWLRLSGILETGETYAVTRASADAALVGCANQSGLVDPDQFLKHSGDDALAVYYIGGLGDAEENWGSGILLDMLGDPDFDPGNAYDVSGVPEATRYHIVQRKFNVCGGNGGDWNTSRGCVDDTCTETSYVLSEWEVINCSGAVEGDPMYPEPNENGNHFLATADMAVVCGGHQYLCLGAPNSPPGEFGLVSPVDNSSLNVNEGNVNQSLLVDWTDSYDSDEDELVYTFNLYDSDTITVLYSENITTTSELSIGYATILTLSTGEGTTLSCFWDVSVSDGEDTAVSTNGPLGLEISFQDGSGLNQPPTDFELESFEDYTLLYVDPNQFQLDTLYWSASEDPDGEAITYTYIISYSENMNSPIIEVVTQNNYLAVDTETIYNILVSDGLEESALYWDIVASDGEYSLSSSNGPFMVYCYIGQDPEENEETYVDLFISDWYIGYRSNPTYNNLIELYNPKSEPINLSNYIIRRTSNGSHWMESSWVRLSGVLPAQTTYVITRASADISMTSVADYIDPDEFFKHNGDDGFAITSIEHLPVSLSSDTTAWMKMSVFLDAIGSSDEDPGVAWDVSGISNATRYHMMSRKASSCGGNAGDWSRSRGCADEACDSTLSSLSEWNVLGCAESVVSGDMPSTPDATSDVAVFCGFHNYQCSVTASIDNQNNFPFTVSLEQNYPNPFNPKTNIKFNLGIKSYVEVVIYNINGRVVRNLLSTNFSAGTHSISWDGRNMNGEDSSSGMYFYEISVGDAKIQKKMILMR